MRFASYNAGKRTNRRYLDWPLRYVKNKIPKYAKAVFIQDGKIWWEHQNGDISAREPVIFLADAPPELRGFDVSGGGFEPNNIP